MSKLNYDLEPRTYSIKSYKKRGSFSFKKFLIFFLLLVVIAAIAVLALMTKANLI